MFLRRRERFKEKVFLGGDFLRESVLRRKSFKERVF